MHRLTEVLRDGLKTIGAAVRGFAARALCRLEAARNGGRRRRMRVIESLALGGRRQLLLVTCDEQEYLVGTGAESVETIVLRQPAQAGAGSSLDGAALSQQAADMQPQREKARQASGHVSGQAAGHAAWHGGAQLRERGARGLWLVTPGGGVVAENRIREAGLQEAGLGRGWELWQ